jgi:CheY-like chemotaxis protein
MMHSTDHQLLITDDDVDFRHTLSDALTRRGYRTCLAADGVEALEVIEQGGIHLALFDVHMPRLDGLGALASLRQQARQLPCILMSAELDDRILETAHALRAERVLPKPFTLAALVESVRSLLDAAYGSR